MRTPRTKRRMIGAMKKMASDEQKTGPSPSKVSHEHPCTIDLDLQIESTAPDIPEKSFFEDCTRRVLSSFRNHAELTIRLVDAEESRELNRRWRGINEPTNVLSFPVEGLEHAVPDLLGDVVICIALAHAEADASGIARKAHWAHLIAHGILHLLGFDHDKESQAREMEDKEHAILSDMGYPYPKFAC